MISFPIGAILTAIVFILSMGIDSLQIYFNLHSLILVGGGTVTIMLFSSPNSVIKNLGREVMKLFKPQMTLSGTQQDLVALATNRESTLDSKDELLLYAQDLWIQGISQDLFVVLLSQKRKEIEQRAVDSIQCLKNLAKYPPALGMAGTVMGIVSLFQALESSKNNIGPALAMALTATFFGLAVANGIVMPLADRLQVVLIAQKQYLQNVYQVLLLINQDEPVNLIEDEVKLRAA